MSYIKKQKIIKVDLDFIMNRVEHIFNQGYDLGFKAGRVMILNDIRRIINENEYPEDLEFDLCNYMEERANENN